jgi:inactivated superfamily I helicase
MNAERRFFCHLAEVAHTVAEEARERLVQTIIQRQKVTDAKSSVTRICITHNRFGVELFDSGGTDLHLGDATMIDIAAEEIFIDGEMLEDPDDPNELADLLCFGVGLSVRCGELGYVAEP